MKFTITREIGIDAGHRIPDHGSKCRNIHGHRYRILATVSSDRLHPSGEQKGMVLDFSFLKAIMMDEIDTPCDHGLILSRHDPLLSLMVDEETVERIQQQFDLGLLDPPANRYRVLKDPWGKLYIIDNPPTAEVLAQHWYRRIAPKVMAESKRLAKVESITVWETPNCYAVYPLWPHGVIDR